MRWSVLLTGAGRPDMVRIMKHVGTDVRRGKDMQNIGSPLEHIGCGVCFEQDSVLSLLSNTPHTRCWYGLVLHFLCPFHVTNIS